jgi:hypothetical protein
MFFDTDASISASKYIFEAKSSCAKEKKLVND